MANEIQIQMEEKEMCPTVVKDVFPHEHTAARDHEHNIGTRQGPSTSHCGWGRDSRGPTPPLPKEV